jgi:hypothetical protein
LYEAQARAGGYSGAENEVSNVVAAWNRVRGRLDRRQIELAVIAWEIARLKAQRQAKAREQSWALDLTYRWRLVAIENESRLKDFAAPLSEGN